MYSSAFQWFTHNSGSVSTIVKVIIEKKKKKAQPPIQPFLTSPLSFQTCSQDEITDKAKKRHEDTVSHLPRLPQPSYASRFCFSLKQCDIYASEFCSHVQDAIAYFRQGIISFCFRFSGQCSPSKT